MKGKHVNHPELLVIGGGLAAMEAALDAARAYPEMKIQILSKKPVGLSGASLVAMSVHRYAPEDPELRESYRRDFLASGHGLSDPKLVEVLVREGAEALRQRESMGLPLEFKYRKNARGKELPYLACCNPKYGRNLTEPMGRLVADQKNVSILDGCMAVDLLKEGDRVRGVLAEKDDRLFVIEAKAVILACGGGGRIYQNTSNTSDLTGDGYGLALRAGLPLRDMEFVQFYPYRIFSPGCCNIFPDIFEHGAVFRNEKGRRFMEDYPKKELENRDVLAREMFRQKKVIFDPRDCEREYLKRECTAIHELWQKHPESPMLVKPVAHFMMGGIPLRPDGSTGIAGLYCCGEVTGGLHGANRLAGSALTETAVFGRRAGLAAAEYSRALAGFPNGAPPEQLAAEQLENWPVPLPGSDDPAPLVREIRKVMWEKASLIRERRSMEEAESRLKELDRTLEEQHPVSLRSWLEARNILTTARTVLAAALLRQESRGAHYRLDYPETSEEWQGSIYVSTRGNYFVPQK
ncbi:MAG: FAD-binding protein [Peptococcaceae bacterium]|nr:FAD-binding protein [Peptococcaceae bacterium]